MSGISTFISALADFIGGGSPSLPSSAGPKGLIDERDMWFFTEAWQARDAQAADDVRMRRFVDFADPASLTIALTAPKGTAAHAAIEALRVGRG